MRNFLGLLVFFIVQPFFGQKTEFCTSQNESDVNAINKCIATNSRNVIERKNRKNKSHRFLKKRKSFIVNETFFSKPNQYENNVAVKEVVESPFNNITSFGIDISICKKPVKIPFAVNSKLLKNQVVRFSQVEEIPMFTSCKNKSKDKNVECFNKKMRKHIQKHFTYPKEAQKNNIQGDVWVRFIINKDGYISNLEAKVSKNKQFLEKEALRLVRELPKFRPGKIAGNPVNTRYCFPISLD